jgi:Tfp pilus assembly protein PilO
MSVGSLNRRTLFFLLGGLAVIAVLRFGVYGDRQSVAPVFDSAPLAEKRLASLRQKAATVSGEEAVLKQAVAELQGREKGIIDAPTAAQAQAQLLEIIQHVAAANGFDAHGVEAMPQPKPLGGDYGEVSVTETFTCGIDQLANFLAALANEPQLLATDEVQITGGADKRKNVQVRLSLSGVVPRKLVPEKKGGASF